MFIISVRVIAACRHLFIVYYFFKWGCPVFSLNHVLTVCGFQFALPKVYLLNKEPQLESLFVKFPDLKYELQQMHIEKSNLAGQGVYLLQLCSHNPQADILEQKTNQNIPLLNQVQNSNPSSTQGHVNVRNNMETTGRCFLGHPNSWF